MEEYTYRNEHGELWKLQIDECGVISLGGDETGWIMWPIISPPMVGNTFFSWSEMAWLATVMTQLESRRLIFDKEPK